MSLNFTSVSRVSGITGYSGSSTVYEGFPVSHSTVPFRVFNLGDSVDFSPVGGEWFQAEGHGSVTRPPQSIIAIYFGAKSFDIDLTFAHSDGTASLNLSRVAAIGTDEVLDIDYEEITSLSKMYSLNAREYPTGHGDEGTPVDGGAPTLPHWSLNVEENGDLTEYLGLEAMRDQGLGAPRLGSGISYYAKDDIWYAPNAFRLSGRVNSTIGAEPPAYINPSEQVVETDRTTGTIPFLGGAYHYTIDNGTLTGEITVSEWLPIYDPIS